ncbi:Reverse transcriptase (RNA-dependent DNA polymerase) [Popillia japonica]|uniref:Reverse transcriptase (RNA-dependent DNA polymerase) n=1 Tax=Popillia japonica TaxID=7064 RepID=A0AAW1HVT9_POPJA
MDGDENTTKKLIGSITLYADLLKADDKKHLINFVLKTRISENAKIRLNKSYDSVDEFNFVLKTRISENAKIRLNKSYDSVDELIKDIRNNFVARTSATTISTQLHQIKQQNKTLSEFGQEIEQLLSEWNFEQFSFSFWINTDKIILPLESKYNVYTVIPPRCEIIKYFWVDDVDDCVVLPNEIAQGVFIAGIIARPNLYFWVDDVDDCVVLPNEIAQGVFIAGIIARPNLHTIPIRILNTNDKEIKIKNFKPTTAKLYNFESYTFDSNQITVNRVDNILDLINVTGLNKEEQHSICAKYADVFLLDNDPVTVTNITQETITLRKNKQWRIVIDYRLLNKSVEDDRFPLPNITEILDSSVEDDRFPLPNITEILDSLSGAFYFTYLDLSQGYYLVELDQNSRKYTAFTTSKGKFQMTRLPMGLKTSPSSFSRVMTIAMSGLNFESCFVYLDDLIVFGNNLQNHKI